MPFTSDEFRWDVSCGIGPDGHWHGWFSVSVHPEARRRLGLHSDQPTAQITSPASPGHFATHGP
jgi:hypothetical protein